MDIEVFKFGGISIANKENIEKVANIIKKHTASRIFIVISAMGKTTNHLEKVVAFYFIDKDAQRAMQLFEQIKQTHYEILYALIPQPAPAQINELETLCHETIFTLNSPIEQNYSYYYDQIIGIGELLSTRIISMYLEYLGIKNKWLDVRDYLITDNNFQKADIIWETTLARTEKNILPLFNTHNILITQGFIGNTTDNETSTLGKEGSDFSAAAFAKLLNAEKLTIWKDVPGVMNADPKHYPNSVTLPNLDYREIAEMAYYGAKVIHPKTLQPIYEKNIPLYVRSFLNPHLEQTLIHHFPEQILPPILIHKKNQILLSLHTKNLSFMNYNHITECGNIFSTHRIRYHLIHVEATRLLIRIDNESKEKIHTLIEALQKKYTLNSHEDLTLLTIKNYTPEWIEKVTHNKEIFVQNQTRSTVQYLLK